MAPRTKFETRAMRERKLRGSSFEERLENWFESLFGAIKRRLHLAR